MYLSENKVLRLCTLCGLYVAQGIPWGFVTVTFAAWLAEPTQGITRAQIGPILGVATLPWSFKFLWGPLMDRFTIPSLGRRRPWIIFAQSMAILVLGSMMLIDDLPGMVWQESPSTHPFMLALYGMIPGPLAGLILLANVFVSMQDVAVDALAVDLLNEKERGVANGLMYGSSYVGTAIGGAGLGYVVAHMGIQAGLFGQAILLALIMLLPVFLRERRNSEAIEERLTESNIPAVAASQETVDFGESPFAPPTVDSSQDRESVFANLMRAFTLRSTVIGAFVAVGVKIGIGVLTAVFVDYLMKQGGWTQEEYTAVTGGWAMLVGLSGAALGGFVADMTGPKPLILVASLCLGVLWIGVGVVPGAIELRFVVTGMLLGQEFLLAVLSVALFSLFMAISWPKVAATQFTAYMALMNLSTTIGSYMAGWLSLSVSVMQILVVAGVLQIVMAIPVMFIDTRQTRRILGDS